MLLVCCPVRGQEIPFDQQSSEGSAPWLPVSLQSTESSGNQKKTADSVATDSVAARKQQRARLISTGKTAFQNRCLQCHDASKSLLQTKTIAGWRTTIARMARQDGADIPQSEREPIAMYLASLSGNAATDSSADQGELEADSQPDIPPVTVFGTISPTLRTNGQEIQNPGFFGDVWGGVAWDPGVGPLSAKMVACISCHNEHDEGYLSRLEIVQASLTLDLGQIARGETSGKRTGNGGAGMCTCRSQKNCPPGSGLSGGQAGAEEIEATVEAGRLVVPFGAFSSQVNPGVYRTVSRPLMFNMGQRVYDENIGDPVLPMPFSDEGAELHISIPLFESITMAMDTYVVNGLQGSNNINFDDSRDYVDNNSTPAVGGRWTLGNNSLRFGSSIISGRYNANAGTGPNNSGLDFLIYGADATYHFKDIVRVQAEFAQRNTNSFYDLATPLYATDHVSGWYVESEVLLSREARLSALMRWDEQSQRYGAFDPDSSAVSTAFDVNRLTYGLNWTVPGGSLLMFNLEHWFLPGGLPDIDVAGARWVVSF